MLRNARLCDILVRALFETAPPARDWPPPDSRSGRSAAAAGGSFQRESRRSLMAITSSAVALADRSSGHTAYSLFDGIADIVSDLPHLFRCTN